MELCFNSYIADDNNITSFVTENKIGVSCSDPSTSGITKLDVNGLPYNPNLSNEDLI